MKNNDLNTSEAGAEQAKVTSAPGTTSYEVIYLGIDVHAQSVTLTRIIDHSTPQPAQRFAWLDFWRFVQKQVALAKKVHAVYEAGFLGFWPCRRLRELGVDCYVSHPEKLDPRHKRVQTDRLDSRHLAENLQRYVLGNRRAMTPVYVPSILEEQQRLEARHRGDLSRRMHALMSRGRGLLTSQGIVPLGVWWEEPAWSQLQERLTPELKSTLEDDRALIVEYKKRLAAVEEKLEASAPKQLPKGMGRLTFVLLKRELCNYQRFPSRRDVAGFTGLCGAVSSSGPYHVELSINKAGNPYVRTLLIELAWRVVQWQPSYTGREVWDRFCGRKEQGRTVLVSKRRKKIAIVALARQLAVDLWKWQTGRVQPSELRWKMVQSQ
jgi:transposase